MTKPRTLRLSLAGREEISRGLIAMLTLTQIAAGLGRSVSTISREANRNSGVNGYRAVRADGLATARTARARPDKLAADVQSRSSGRMHALALPSGSSYTSGHDQCS